MFDCPPTSKWMCVYFNFSVGATLFKGAYAHHFPPPTRSLPPPAGEALHQDVAEPGDDADDDADAEAGADGDGDGVRRRHPHGITGCWFTCRTPGGAPSRAEVERLRPSSRDDGRLRLRATRATISSTLPARSSARLGGWGFGTVLEVVAKMGAPKIRFPEYSSKVCNKAILCWLQIMSIPSGYWRRKKEANFWSVKTLIDVKFWIESTALHLAGIQKSIISVSVMFFPLELQKEEDRRTLRNRVLSLVNHFIFETNKENERNYRTRQKLNISYHFGILRTISGQREKTEGLDNGNKSSW